MRRVLVDTNVIISALLFPDSAPAVAFGRILAGERLVLTRWIIDELHAVVEVNRPDLVSAVDGCWPALSLRSPSQGQRAGPSPTRATSRSWTLGCPAMSTSSSAATGTSCPWAWSGPRS